MPDPMTDLIPVPRQDLENLRAQYHEDGGRDRSVA